MYPPLDQIREVSIKIAVAVAEHAYRHGKSQLRFVHSDFLNLMLELFSGLATKHPKPKCMETYIRAQCYDYHYTPSVASVYEWN
jgi:hypothetical protein